MYRGHPVQEVAAKKSFEEVTHLLLIGEFPDAGQLTSFTATERSRRTLDDKTEALIDSLSTEAHPNGCASYGSVMTLGDVSDEAGRAAFDTSMILYAERSSNTSTFTARVITATPHRLLLGRGRCDWLPLKGATIT